MSMGPNIVADGLVFAVDGANNKSAVNTTYTNQTATFFTSSNSDGLTSNSADFDIGSGSFTCGHWIYFKEGDFDAVAKVSIVMNGTDQQVANHNWRVESSLSGANEIIQFRISDGTTSKTVSSNAVTGYLTLNENIWYFLVWVYDFDANLIKVSVNGSDYATVDTTGVVPQGGTFGLSIGERQWPTTNYFSGYLKNFFFYNKALSNTDAKVLYHQGVVNSYEKLFGSQKNGLVSWYNLTESGSGTRIDSHGSNNLTDVNGVQSISTVTGSYTYIQDVIGDNFGIPESDATLLDGSWEFDGTDDEISLPDLDFLTSTSQFSFEVWTKHDIDGSVGAYFSSGTSFTNDILISFDPGTQKWFAQIDNGADTTGLTPVQPAGTVIKWNHLAVVFDGTLSGDANRQKIYINGILQTLTFTGGSVPATTSAFAGTNCTIGDYVLAGGWNHNGHISTVKFWNRPLTAQEILQNFNATKHRFGIK